MFGVKPHRRIDPLGSVSSAAASRGGVLPLVLLALLALDLAHALLDPLLDGKVDLLLVRQRQGLDINARLSAGVTLDALTIQVCRTLPLTTPVSAASPEASSAVETGSLGSRSFVFGACRGTCSHAAYRSLGRPVLFLRRGVLAPILDISSKYSCRRIVPNRIWLTPNSCAIRSCARPCLCNFVATPGTAPCGQPATTPPTSPADNRGADPIAAHRTFALIG